MSKYTTEVRFICETAAGYTESQGYDKVEQIISQSRNKIFDFDYPIFDSDYKSVIETKILKHYYTREIGVETVGLWKHFLNMRMNEIMPYYNKLYESELLEFNPLYNVKYDTTHRGSASGTSTDEVEGTELTTRNLTDAETRNLADAETRNYTDAETRNLTDLETRNMTDTQTKNLTDTVESDTGVTTSNDTLEKFSDTPQGAVTNLNNGTYLTNAKQTENDVDTDTEYDETARHTGTDTIAKTGTDTIARTGTDTINHTGTDTFNHTGTDTFNHTGTNNVAVDNTKNSEFSNTDQYLRHVEGNNGNKSFSELLMEYRKSFINIDMMVINDLHDLFMGVW